MQAQLAEHNDYSIKDFYKSFLPPPTIKQESKNDFSFRDDLKGETRTIKGLLEFQIDQQFINLNELTLTQKHKQNQVNEDNIQDLNRYEDIIPFDIKNNFFFNENKFFKSKIYRQTYSCEATRAYQQRLIYQCKFHKCKKEIHSIQCPLKEKAFIATQGPLPNTFMKFWRMVWEQNVDFILMMCKEQVKCDQYWPNKGDVLSEGSLQVQFVNEVRKPELNIIERTFLIKDDENERLINQVHWEGWPDHGVPQPQDYHILENLIQRIVQQFEQQKVPIVHCSAGVGRTGTLIAIVNIYIALKYHKINNTPIDKIDLNIFDMVRRLREQRIYMVERDSQLQLVYDISKDLIKKLFQL